MSDVKKLEEKFLSHKATIGIIGLGYVGLPLMLRYTEVGFKALGFDVDDKKIKALKAGKSYIEHLGSDRVKSAMDKGMDATIDMSRIAEVDAIILCVPTPLNEYREPDLSFVINTIDSILPYIKANQVVSLESTTYPGTTDEEIVPRVQSKGFTIGKDFFVIFSPEREDPGNAHFSTSTIPKVVGGYTANCLTIGKALYGTVINKIVPVSSTKVAEMTKLLENIHRSVNIGLVNEMKIVADKMGIDIHEVIDAAATKPFGFVAYRPGPGIGGHCIPIDPFYLTWKAREYGLHTRFIELAGEINSSMPEYVINRMTSALNEKCKSIKNSKVLILGVAYKKNVDDMRESPSLELIKELKQKGAQISYHDPHVPFMPTLRKYHFEEMHSIELTEKAIQSFDVVLLATDHDKVNYDLIIKHANLIIDTRGKLNINLPNVVRA